MERIGAEAYWKDDRICMAGPIDGRLGLSGSSRAAVCSADSLNGFGLAIQISQKSVNIFLANFDIRPYQYRSTQAVHAFPPVPNR